jgi:hypothetical protein
MSPCNSVASHRALFSHPVQRLRLLVQAAEGLLQIHDRGILHGDMTLRNLLLRGDALDVALSGFGKARARLGKPGEGPLGAAQIASGPVRWMAPVRSVAHFAGWLG